ncbi:MAG: hypothetical protein AB1646_03120 [Thermodesulfobacteriota bacterium]
MRLPGIMIAVAVPALLLGTWLTLSAQPLLMAGQAGSPAGVPDVLASPIPHDFDRQACETDCRSRFGVNPWAAEEGSSPYWRGGGGSSFPYEAFAQCMQQCNERFWKDHDRRMRDLERE